MARQNRLWSPTAVIGITIVAVNLIAAICAQWIAPFGETEVVGNVWMSPDSTHWLGTDNLGRDVFSRVLYGAQNSITIALVTTALAFFLGVTGGFLAAVAGGWVDTLMGRVVDLLISIPALIFAFLVLTILGTGTAVLIIAIAVFESTRVYRVARAVALDVTVMDYVEVAKLRGENFLYVMRREVLPNVTTPLLVDFGLRFCFVFLFLSTLSFLGLGVQPPAADWGSMVRDNAGGISFGILTPMYPAAAIALLSIGINLILDSFAHGKKPADSKSIEVTPPPAVQPTDKAPGDLLQMRGLRIEAASDDGWNEIVHGVDLDLNRGEVIGLIGESGAGKSTIGLAAMAYARHGCRISGGEIWFDGQDLAKASAEDLRKLRGVRISYVAQSAAAFFDPAHKLVNQYIETPVQHSVLSAEQARSDAIEIFGKLRMPDPEVIGTRYPHQVSGGQLQRAMVAMAMSCKPDLIIFDEPTTALDVTTQIEVLSAIRDVIRDSNTAALYITHDLAVVAQVADRIMVLRDGALVEENATKPILEAPQQDYTRKLLSVRTPQGEARARSGDEMIVQANNICVNFGAKQALKNVSIEAPKGSAVAIIGESGSGKTTLARCIAGIQHYSDGDVMFDGKRLANTSKKRTKEQLRRVQMIYQMPDTALNPRQTIRKIIGRPLEFYHGIKGQAQTDRVIELLELIGMGAEFLNRTPDELSGGQKQRICIARALAAEPDVLICDEATSALDAIVADGILRLLKKLQDELGLTYLFITHDFSAVEVIADEVVVMANGEVVEHGTKSDVLEDPQQAYTQQLLASVPKMDTTWLTKTIDARASDTQRVRSL
ncbi:MAG: nickel ABC transporter ATP-binding protein NikE [Cognatishimia sp.]